MIPSCPECGLPGVPLLFGLPVPEARQAAEDGDLALGGCVTPGQAPNWQCASGHRWRDADQGAWDSRLSAVLAAHGYRD
ncbi:hypothetical protein AB0M02_18445 [Actinoplanes sp. NPDC051861]|uniref:hypothetical protein n=1 Tax=Actinoplanes sp. NPDC051861 TaxID=3155170 RepID=UPI00341C4CA4